MPDKQDKQTPQTDDKQAAEKKQSYKTPKSESTAEYEGAEERKPTGEQAEEVKTETSSSSGQ